MPYHISIIQAVSNRYGGFQWNFKVRQQTIDTGRFCDSMMVYITIYKTRMKTMVYVLQLCGELCVKLLQKGILVDKGCDFHDLQGVCFLYLLKWMHADRCHILSCQLTVVFHASLKQ